MSKLLQTSSISHHDSSGGDEHHPSHPHHHGTKIHNTKNTNTNDDAADDDDDDDEAVDLGITTTTTTTTPKSTAHKKKSSSSTSTKKPKKTTTTTTKKETKSKLLPSTTSTPSAPSAPSAQQDDIKTKKNKTKIPSSSSPKKKKNKSTSSTSTASSTKSEEEGTDDDDDDDTCDHKDETTTTKTTKTKKKDHHKVGTVLHNHHSHPHHIIHHHQQHSNGNTKKKENHNNEHKDDDDDKDGTMKQKQKKNKSTRTPTTGTAGTMPTSSTNSTSSGRTSIVGHTNNGGPRTSIVGHVLGEMFHHNANTTTTTSFDTTNEDIVGHHHHNNNGRTSIVGHVLGEIFHHNDADTTTTTTTSTTSFDTTNEDIVGHHHNGDTRTSIVGHVLGDMFHHHNATTTKTSFDTNEDIWEENSDDQVSKGITNHWENDLNDDDDNDYHRRNEKEEINNFMNDYDNDNDDTTTEQVPDTLGLLLHPTAVTEQEQQHCSSTTTTTTTTAKTLNTTTGAMKSHQRPQLKKVIATPEWSVPALVTDYSDDDCSSHDNDEKQQHQDNNSAGASTSTSNKYDMNRNKSDADIYIESDEEEEEEKEKEKEDNKDKPISNLTSASATTNTTQTAITDDKLVSSSTSKTKKLKTKKHSKDDGEDDSKEVPKKTKTKKKEQMNKMKLNTKTKKKNTNWGKDKGNEKEKQVLGESTITKTSPTMTPTENAPGKQDDNNDVISSNKDERIIESNNNNVVDDNNDDDGVGLAGWGRLGDTLDDDEIEIRFSSIFEVDETEEDNITTNDSHRSKELPTSLPPVSSLLQLITALPQLQEQEQQNDQKEKGGTKDSLISPPITSMSQLVASVMTSHHQQQQQQPTKMNPTVVNDEDGTKESPARPPLITSTTQLIASVSQTNQEQPQLGKKSLWNSKLRQKVLGLRRQASKTTRPVVECNIEGTDGSDKEELPPSISSMPQLNPSMSQRQQQPQLGKKSLWNSKLRQKVRGLRRQASKTTTPTVVVQNVEDSHDRNVEEPALPLSSTSHLNLSMSQQEQSQSQAGKKSLWTPKLSQEVLGPVVVKNNVEDGHDSTREPNPSMGGEPSKMIPAVTQRFHGSELQDRLKDLQYAGTMTSTGMLLASPAVGVGKRMVITQESADWAFERESLELQLEEEREKNNAFKREMEMLQIEIQNFKSPGGGEEEENAITREPLRDVDIVSVLTEVETLRRQLERVIMAKSQLEKDKNVEIEKLVLTIEDMKQSGDNDDNDGPVGLGQMGRLQGDLLQAKSKISDRDAKIAKLQRESTELRDTLEQYKSSEVVPKLKHQIETLSREKEMLMEQLVQDQEQCDDKLKVMRDEVLELKKQLGMDASMSRSASSDSLNSSLYLDNLADSVYHPYPNGLQASAPVLSKPKGLGDSLRNSIMLSASTSNIPLGDSVRNSILSSSSSIPSHEAPIVPKLRHEIAILSKEKEMLMNQLIHDQGHFDEELKGKGERIDVMKNEILQLKQQLKKDTSLHSITNDPYNASLRLDNLTNPYQKGSDASAPELSKPNDGGDNNINKDNILSSSAPNISATPTPGTRSGLFSMKWLR